MSPVRKVQGKQMSAASGSSTPQKLSIRIVRITGALLLGLRLSTRQRGGPSAVGRDCLHPSVQPQFPRGCPASIPSYAGARHFESLVELARLDAVAHAVP